MALVTLGLQFAKDRAARRNSRAIKYYSAAIEQRREFLETVRQQFKGRPVLQWCAVVEAEIELLGHVRDVLATIDMHQSLRFATDAHEGVVDGVIAIHLDSLASGVNTQILNDKFRVSLGYLLLKGHPDAPKVLEEYREKLRAFNKKMEPHRRVLNQRRDSAAHPTWRAAAIAPVDVHALALAALESILELLKLLSAVSPMRGPVLMDEVAAERRVAELDALLARDG